jgi:plasmid stabilization system protein ParE
MTQYFITISDEAMIDIDRVVDYIHSELQEPETAKRYYDGLIHTIQTLSVCAGSIGFNPYVQAMFGKEARQIIYKKMTIIYVVSGSDAYVKRVIAGSLIK